MSILKNIFKQRLYKIRVLCSSGDACALLTWKECEQNIGSKYMLINNMTQEKITNEKQLKESTDTIAVPQFVGG